MDVGVRSARLFSGLVVADCGGAVPADCRRIPRTLHPLRSRDPHLGHAPEPQYSVYSTQLTTGRRRFGKDFQTAQRLIGRLALGDNPPVLLERVRGVMWGVMAASDSLSVVLREGYALHADVLPFTFAP